MPAALPAAAALLTALPAAALLALALAAPAGAQAPAPDAAPQPAPVIAAAADLQFAIEEIAEAFTRDTGQALRLTLGSTGNFARQIRAGAPFQIFMAADEQFVLDLHRDGFTADAGDLYAIGRIGLIVPTGGALAADAGLDGLEAALAAGTITRFAIANPEHAPYGRRAEEALRHRGLWQDLAPHLVLGENVLQAAQFALSGNAEGGIVAASLALAPPLAARGAFALIPEDWHSPLRQRMVLLDGAGETARAFYTYLMQPPARQILARHGFALPEDG